MTKKTTTTKKTAQSPLLLRCHRLMDAFAKSDDERDFYLDNQEGFIVFVDLDKSKEELDKLAKEIDNHADRYCMIPKLTFYETKKIMEGFVHDKVYDIDVKEKLIDIIQSKEARENFLEFIYDHHTELEKWQQFYQERSRIRIIEWLRNNHFHFVFEEDLELGTSVIDKMKRNLFEKKVAKDIEVARKVVATKAKSYYSNEALNPRPKRGRPPKQQLKLEVEPQITNDIYTTVPTHIRPFLFTPEITSIFDVTFSAKFDSKEELLASRKEHAEEGLEQSMESINLKLASLRELSTRWHEKEGVEDTTALAQTNGAQDESLDFMEPEEKELFAKLEARKTVKKKTPLKKPAKAKPAAIKKPKKAPAKRIITKAKMEKSKAKPKTPAKRPARKITPKKVKG